MTQRRVEELDIDELEELIEYATAEEAEFLTHLLSARVALRSPLDYACYVSPSTVRYPHVEVINDHIVALCEYRLYKSGPGPHANWFYKTAQGVFDIDGVDELEKFLQSEEGHTVLEFWGEHPETRERVVFRLALSAPPRHGKSWITTLHTPGWYKSRWPNRHQAIATYSDEFSWEWGEKILNQLEDRNSFVQVHGNRQRIKDKNFDADIRFVGVGGKLTGTGWHFGLIDDPFKNSEEALSEVARTSKDNWYGSTWLTRREPMAVEVLMFTRWHEDDLSGRRVYKDDSLEIRDDWCILEMPAIALDIEDSPREGYVDVIGREPGEALCPARKTLAQLETIRDQDPVWFQAMYQGLPSIEAGGILPAPYNHYTEYRKDYVLDFGDSKLAIPKVDCERFGVIDLAASTKDWADYSVFSVWDWHRSSQNLLLVHAQRERVDSSRHLEWAKGICHTYGVGWVGIEERTFGLTLIQLFQRQGGFFIKPLFAGNKDKIQRAIPYGAAIGRKQVWFPEGAAWLGVWENEHKNFPNTKHDDQVDTGAYAWEMTLSMPAKLHEGKKAKTFEDECWDQLERRSGRRGSIASMLRL